MTKGKNTVRALSVIILLCILTVESVLPVYGADVKSADLDGPNSVSAYVPDELLVMYQEEVTDGQVEAMVEEQGDEGVEVLSKMEEGTIAAVSISGDTSVEEAITEYEADERVVSVTPNYKLELFSDAPVNDSLYSKQGYLEQMNVPGAWNIVNKASHEKVKVAVLDTGADIEHPDLEEVLNIQESKEVLSADGVLRLEALKGDGYKNGVASPGGGHGTHVTGIVAAEANNGQGIAGVGSALDNSVIDLISIDVFSEDSTTNVKYVIKGLEYAKNIGAKVINLSLGIRKSEIQQNDKYLKEMCDSLANQGIIIVCAAGNYGTEDNGRIDVVPSDYDSTISVISVNRNNQKAQSSCYGSLKDISAPGETIYSTVKGGNYASMSGTSMAAPGITGVIAMMCFLDSNLDVGKVRGVLRNTATDIGTPGYDIYTGAGLVNAKKAVEAVAPEGGGATENTVLPYGDVKESEWYYESVAYMYNKGIMTGLRPTVFGPTGKVSRAQFATILYRISGANSVKYSSRFPDVPKGQFYTDAVMWAASEGIIKGYENGYFGPGDLITREQMAVLLYRYVQYLGADVSNKNSLDHFPDSRFVSGFALEAMQWANAEGVIMGNADSTLAPRAYADRASCATMMMRFMKKY